jgi:hypothetical protein
MESGRLLEWPRVSATRHPQERRPLLRSYALGWIDSHIRLGQDAVREATRVEYKRLLTTFAFRYLPPEIRLGELTSSQLHGFRQLAQSTAGIERPALRAHDPKCGHVAAALPSVRQGRGPTWRRCGPSPRVAAPSWASPRHTGRALSDSHAAGSPVGGDPRAVAAVLRPAGLNPAYGSQRRSRCAGATSSSMALPISWCAARSSKGWSANPSPAMAFAAFHSLGDWLHSLRKYGRWRRRRSRLSRSAWSSDQSEQHPLSGAGAGPQACRPSARRLSRLTPHLRLALDRARSFSTAAPTVDGPPFRCLHA